MVIQGLEGIFIGFKCPVLFYRGSIRKQFSGPSWYPLEDFALNSGLEFGFCNLGGMKVQGLGCTI